MTSVVWRNCSSCKKTISVSTKYFACSVSTCNHPRTGYVFCTVSCFERHLPGARHRDAGAIEKIAPASVQETSENGSPRPPSRIIVGGQSSPSMTSTSSNDVLIIASRLKEYIQSQSGFNTSASVMQVLSDYLRILCDRAIDEARADGRKTVMDRDFEFLKNLTRSY